VPALPATQTPMAAVDLGKTTKANIATLIECLYLFVVGFL